MVHYTVKLRIWLPWRKASSFKDLYRVDVVSSIPLAAAETAAPGGDYPLISGAVIDCHQPQGVPINYPWHSSIFSSLSLFRFLMRVLLACVSSFLDRAVVLLPPESPPPRVLLCWCRSTNTSGLPWERTRTCLTFCSRVVYGSWAKKTQSVVRLVRLGIRPLALPSCSWHLLDFRRQNFYLHLKRQTRVGTVMSHHACVERVVRSVYPPLCPSPTGTTSTKQPTPTSPFRVQHARENTFSTLYKKRNC